MLFPYNKKDEEVKICMEFPPYLTERLRTGVEAELECIVNRIQELEPANLEKQLEIEPENQIFRGPSVSKIRRDMPDSQVNESSMLEELVEHVSSIVGLKGMLFAKPVVIRYIWALLFWPSIGATIFFLYKTFIEYLSYPTATNIIIRDNEVYSFPPLLLCPESWFDANKAYDSGLSAGALEYSLSYMEDYFEAVGSNASDAREEFLNFYNSKKFESLIDYYSFISPNLRPMESARGNATSATYICYGCTSEDTIAEKTLLDGVLCYSFRLRPVEKTFGAYSGSRRIYITFTDQTMGVVPLSKVWFLYFRQHRDSLISVHPKVTVRVNYKHVVMFYRNSVISLNKADKPCVENTDKREYSAPTCMARCQNELYKKTINCKLLWLSGTSEKLSPTEACNHLEKYTKENLSLTNFLDSEENAHIEYYAAHDCSAQCPKPCQQDVMDTTKKMQAPIDMYTGVRRDANGKKTIELQIILKHAAVYQSGTMVFTERRTYTPAMLIDNIGGILGVFVGGTVLSIAELGLFFIGYIYRRYNQ